MATLSWSNSSSLEDGTMNNSSNIFRNYEESEFDEYEPCEGEYDFGSSHNNNVSILFGKNLPKHSQCMQPMTLPKKKNKVLIHSIFNNNQT